MNNEFFKNEIDKIKIPEDKLNKALENGIRKGKRKKNPIAKKIVYLLGAAVIFFSLFVGSAFIYSPIGAIASKIPYLSALFKEDSLEEIILQKLVDKGYKVDGVGTSYKPFKQVEVTVVGSSQYYNSVHQQIKTVVNDILQSKGYDSYSIKVVRLKNLDNNLTEKEKETISFLNKKVSNGLIKSGYNFNSVDVAPWEKTVYIDVEGSKDYYNDVKPKIEKDIKKVLAKNNYSNYEVKVSRISLQIKKVDSAESKVVNVIGEGLMSKEKYKVKSITYKEKPLTFIIDTTIQSSDKDSKALGNDIENEVEQLMKSKDVVTRLGDKSFKLVIYSADHKKIN